MQPELETQSDVILFKAKTGGADSPVINITLGGTPLGAARIGTQSDTILFKA